MMITLTVVCLESLWSFLLVAEDEVNPEVKPLGDILTLKSITTLTHKVTRVYQPAPNETIQAQLTD